MSYDRARGAAMKMHNTMREDKVRIILKIKRREADKCGLRIQKSPLPYKFFLGG